MSSEGEQLRREIEERRMFNGQNPAPEPKKLFTSCGFGDEDKSLAEFDRRVAMCEAFTVHEQVNGTILVPRPGTSTKSVRIDRILSPRKKLIDAGWPHGPIGIEAKASGKELGPVLSQALDYTRALFEMPYGYMVMLQWVFVWPFSGDIGDIASIMAQNRIGSVDAGRSNRCSLVFRCAGTNGIVVHADGSVEAKELPMGKKAGNRG